MIDPVSTQLVPQNTLRTGPEGFDIRALRMPEGAIESDGLGASSKSKGGNTFSDLVGGLVRDVDAKSKIAETEARQLMTGESNNIHRSMIAMQESGLSFNLLIEVRNKLVESYQELLRMPV